MWGFSHDGVVPDIVTLGKPMGNGYPIAAVVTTRKIAQVFDQEYGYFNTFGGNPVSAAAAMATLDIIEDENLLDNTLNVGNYALSELQHLADKYAVIADLRGSGLFMGIELMRGDKPATGLAQNMVNAMRRRRVLISTMGRHDNTLKIRPPCVFSRENVDQLIEVIDNAFTEILAHE